MRTYRVCFKTVYVDEYQVEAPCGEAALALATAYVQAKHNGLPLDGPPYAGRITWIYDDGAPYQDEPEVRRCKADGSAEWWDAP
jgi:hypothetical protein